MPRKKEKKPLKVSTPHVAKPKVPRFKTVEDLKLYFKNIDSPLIEAVLFLTDKFEETYKYIDKVNDEIRGNDP